MRQLVPLCSRRVPIYVSLPVVAACAMAGYIASTLQLGGTMTAGLPSARSTSQGQPVAASRVDTQTASEKLRSTPPSAPAKLSPSSNAMVQPPVERKLQAADSVAKPAPPSVLATKLPRRARATRVRSAKVRRPRPTAQQATNTAGSLKSIPIIGPVFSLLQ
jgi:septal ring-binding cell division protein DamX